MSRALLLGMQQTLTTLQWQFGF